jgi:recombination protein RecA
MAQVIPANQHIFIGIVHLMANTSGQGPKWLEKLSNAGQYALATKLRASHFDTIVMGEGDKAVQIGQVIHWKCDRTPLGPPGIKADTILRYGEGIDEYQEYVKLASEINIIKLSGSWYSMEFMDDEKKFKCQGMEKVREWLKANPDQYAILVQKVRESLDLDAA